MKTILQHLFILAVAIIGLGCGEKSAHKATIRPTMPTYALIEIVRMNQYESFQQYFEGHLAGLREAGGKYVVINREPQVMEGSHRPCHAFMIQEWPDTASFHAWYNSDEFRPWHELLLESADIRIALLSGADLREELSLFNIGTEYNKPAYVLTEVHRYADQESFNKYYDNYLRLVEASGGRFLAQQPDYDVIEGEFPEFELVALLQWPTAQDYLNFFGSEDFAIWLELRRTTSLGNVLLFESESLPERLRW
ncbi:MAG: DUF1330 domain-containing protein [bacterium]